MPIGFKPSLGPFFLRVNLKNSIKLRSTSGMMQQVGDLLAAGMPQEQVRALLQNVGSPTQSDPASQQRCEVEIVPPAAAGRSA